MYVYEAESVTVAVIVAVPVPTMVTRPSAFTVATLSSLEEYVTVPSPVLVSALVKAVLSVVLLTLAVA